MMMMMMKLANIASGLGIGSALKSGAFSINRKSATGLFDPSDLRTISKGAQ